MPFRYNAITGEVDLVDTVTATTGVTQIDADAGSALPVAGIINLIGTAVQGISTAGAGNTVTLTIADATETQKGVIELATDAETIAGVDTTRAIVPSALKAKLGTQTANSLSYGTGDTLAFGWTNAMTDGMLVIGSTAGSPQSANLTSTGATVTITNGPNTINLEAGSTTPTSFVTDAGTAIPAASILNVLGGNNISTVGAANNLTINLTGTTNHSIQVGNATGNLTSMGVLGSGQLLIGSVGADPVGANLTSASSTVVITNGAGTINLETGVTVPTSFVTDSGTAIPALGALNIIGTPFIDTAGAGSTVTADLTDNAQATAIHSWNGSLIESAAVTVASDGATITCSVEKSGGGNLTVITSGDYVTWVTAPDTVALTPGTDEVPVENYVYWLVSTATFTASTAGWPATEHAPIATIVCQTAATMAVNLAMKLHAWTDHTVASDGQGHIGDLNFWIRNQNATYKSGVTQTYSIVGAGLSAVTLNTVSGVVLQLHDHTFPAFAAGHDYYVVNNVAAPYVKITDLNTQLIDSANVSMAGRYFSLVIWGVVSEAAADCKIFVNLPSGSYSTAAGVTADSSKYADFTIPAEYKGCGFLISQWNLRHTAAGGGTWSSIDEVDLRGLFPGVSAGSGTAAATQFPDNTFRIFDDGDSTRLIAFEAGGITAGNTRTLTVQDADGIIALSGVANYGTGATSLTDHSVLVGSGTAPITPIAVGTTGQLLVGVSAADPAFGSSAAADFTFTTASAGSTRTLTVSNTDNTNAASHAQLDLVTGGASGGDPYVHFDTGVTEYSFGLDNTSTTDLLKLTDGASPSAGNEILIVDGTTSAVFNVSTLSNNHATAAGLTQFGVRNTNDANATDAARITISSEHTRGDTYLLFNPHADAGGESLFEVGQSQADEFKINVTTNPAAVNMSGTTVLLSTIAGEVTKPLQPAFSAYRNANLANQTGNGAIVTVPFDTEDFDKNADYNNGTYTFTAPVTGRYQFNINLSFYNLTAAMTTGSFLLVTTSRIYRFGGTNIGAQRSSTNGFSSTASFFCEMSATDTAHVTVQISNGAGDTAGINGLNGGDSSIMAGFSGCLVC